MFSTDDDCLCHIKWNHFQQNIGLNFSRLRDSEILTDLTFACEGNQIPAHKLVLFASSPYFEELLKNDTGHSIFHMKDTSVEVIKLILQFVYSGEVKVSTDLLADFVKTAESLQIRGLTQSTEKSVILIEDSELEQSLDKMNEKVVQEIKMVTPSKIKNESSSNSSSSCDGNVSPRQCWSPRINNMPSPMSTDENLENIETPSLPIATKEDLETFNKNLIDNIFLARMRRRLYFLVLYTTPTQRRIKRKTKTRYLMNALFTKELIRQYSWNGKTEMSTYKFKKQFGIIRLIRYGINYYADHTVDKVEIVGFMKMFFKSIELKRSTETPREEM